MRNAHVIKIRWEHVLSGAQSKWKRCNCICIMIKLYPSSIHGHLIEGLGQGISVIIFPLYNDMA